MTLALGLLLGAGLVLTASPWLWPRTARPERTTMSRTRRLLVQAGLPKVSPATLVVVSVALGLAALGVVYVLVPVLPLAVIGAALAAAVPGLVVSHRARVRRRRARTVWPDVVDHLLSAIRSGLALPESLSTLASVGPTDVRAAFEEFDRDYRATGSFGIALDDLKRRLADPVADRLLETLRMSREVGGSDLTSVLRNLSAYLREDAAIRSEVEARQSWVVNAARLGVAAPWIVLVLLATRPEAAAAYNSPAGAVLLAVGLAVTLLAYRLMVALGRLPEERRWFE